MVSARLPHINKRPSVLQLALDKIVMDSKRLQQESFRKRKNNFLRRGHEISDRYNVGVWLCIQKSNGQLYIYNSDPGRRDWPHGAGGGRGRAQDDRGLVGVRADRRPSARAAVVRPIGAISGLRAGRSPLR